MINRILSGTILGHQTDKQKIMDQKGIKENGVKEISQKQGNIVGGLQQITNAIGNADPLSVLEPEDVEAKQKLHREAAQALVGSQFLDIDILPDTAKQEIIGKLIVNNEWHGYVSSPTRMLIKAKNSLILNVAEPQHDMIILFKIQWLYPSQYLEEKDDQFTKQHIKPNLLFKQIALSYPCYAPHIQEYRDELNILDEQIDSMLENISEFSSLQKKMQQLRDKQDKQKGKNAKKKTAANKTRSRASNKKQTVTQKEDKVEKPKASPKNKQQQTPSKSKDNQQKRQSQEKDYGPYVAIQFKHLKTNQTPQYPQKWVIQKGDEKLKDYQQKVFDSQQEYTVERIVDQNTKGKKQIIYLVKYKGFELNPDDWLSQDELAENRALDLWNKEKDVYSHEHTFYKQQKNK